MTGATEIRRILVALDISPGSLAAAEIAADLAALLQAELMGLYVEDADLISLSASPLAREVDLLTSSHYRETENSYFALRLLDNYPELVRAHHGPFAIQAYQNLGSATHQARLHEIGLVMLALRLQELGQVFEETPESELQAALAHDLDDYLWQKTRIPAFDDLEDLEPGWLAECLGRLCEVESMESAGLLLGYDPRHHGLRERGREKFSPALPPASGATSRPSLPSASRSSTGGPRKAIGCWSGPMLRRWKLHWRKAPTSTAPGRTWRARAERTTPSPATGRSSTTASSICAHTPCGAPPRQAGPRLEERVHSFTTSAEVATWISSLEVGTYFTTCGLAALELRLHRLFDKVRQRKIQLGTRETWKHLFRQDSAGRHLLSPGLVETVRMYSEGLGKVTGTETLWPRWGY